MLSKLKWNKTEFWTGSDYSATYLGCWKLIFPTFDFGVCDVTYWEGAEFPQTLMHHITSQTHRYNFQFSTFILHFHKCTHVYPEVQITAFTGQKLWYLWCHLYCSGHVCKCNSFYIFTLLHLSFMPVSEQLPHGELYTWCVGWSYSSSPGAFCDPASSVCVCVCARFSASVCVLAPVCVCLVAVRQVKVNCCDYAAVIEQGWCV